MLQYNLSCRNCANLVKAINICMHKSNPLVFFLFPLSLCLLLCILQFFWVYGIYLLGRSFYISLFDLPRVRGSQRLFKEDTKHLFVLPTLTWENLPWWKKAGEFTGHEVPHGYADFDHADSVSFPDRTIHPKTECPADTFQNQMAGEV